MSTGGDATSVLDELWTELAVGCESALADLVKIARKKYSTHPGAAELGIPSTGMVAYLLVAGERDLSIDGLRSAGDGISASLATRERELGAAIQGERRFHRKWLTCIATAAGMSQNVIADLIVRAESEYPPGEPYSRVPLDMPTVVNHVRERRLAESAPPSHVELTSIGSVVSYAESSVDENLADANAIVHGVLVARTKYGKDLALELTNGLESIQLVVKPSSPCADDARALRAGDRITAEGRIGYARGKRLSIYVEHCATVVDRQLLFEPAALLEGLRRRGLPPRFTLGRATQLTEAVLDEEEYIRYEPSFVSSALRSPEAVESLDVYFPGWGARTSLVPSPIPQLIRASIGLGVPRLYAIARIFTRAIRDGFTGPDSPTAFVIMLNTSVEKALPELEGILATIVSRLLGEPTEASKTRQPWLQLNDGSQLLDENHHQILPRREHPGNRAFDITPFRTAMRRAGSLIEGHVAHVSTDFSYAVASIHIERMLQLLLNQEASRRVDFHGPERLTVSDSPYGRG